MLKLKRLAAKSARSNSILALHQVSHRFGDVTALADVNFAIYPGQIVALIGSSGAGKSTLLQLLNGTLQPTAGEVWAMGQPWQARSARRIQRQIGTIYQQFHLVPSLRVIHNVNAGHLGRWPFWKAAASLVWPLDVETAQAALVQVGIPDKLYARTDRLSGGQQQRVAIARVLVQDPAIMLADEPIASLDPERSHDIMRLLSRLVRERGKTLVVSLHGVEYAQQYCDRIIGLKQGQLLFDMPAQKVTPPMLKQLYHCESG
ncbi:phosphonate ABC transporter ATP-binding protein [Acaryochloris sp. IP29b_bin.148]|uniref:phosphonate ABC transporter ATP-binding protein n=1 Tax=Acaryochloris sp. IP29b_bin.148 TaxID=2969218 RepID=UPI0026051B80|nr:phosphonate ABC transporter ATP-binding protein [Acaryochloris sp. IP29b_bin.148]